MVHSWSFLFITLSPKYWYPSLWHTFYDRNWSSVWNTTWFQDLQNLNFIMILFFCTGISDFCLLIYQKCCLRCLGEKKTSTRKFHNASCAWRVWNLLHIACLHFKRKPDSEKGTEVKIMCVRYANECGKMQVPLKYVELSGIRIEKVCCGSRTI